MKIFVNSNVFNFTYSAVKNEQMSSLPRLKLYQLIVKFPEYLNVNC
jgi:hypothetical protein